MNMQKKYILQRADALLKEIGYEATTNDKKTRVEEKDIDFIEWSEHPNRDWKKMLLLKFFFVMLLLLTVGFLTVYFFLQDLTSLPIYQACNHLSTHRTDVYADSAVRNILLIGSDARNCDEASRSDAIMIASINEKEKIITLTSILRDSYVNIPDYKWQRINAAYEHGGANLLIQTIEDNFKIAIDSYVQVDFFSFIDLVDAVGGVDIDVDEEELNYINGYLNEINSLLEITDGSTNYIDPATVTNYGIMHLNGAQALAYSRIRYIGTDFQRTARQREVINAILASARQSSLSNLIQTAKIILPQITTDINAEDMKTLLLKAVFYMNYELQEFRVPADDTWSDLIVEGVGQVLQIDFETNQSMLKATIYGE